MLRSLGRNAALERSFPVGKHNPTLLALRHRNVSVTIETSNLTSSSRYTFSTSARLLTTPPPSTKSTSSTETPIPTPPALKPSSKPKVDLRPGPIKSGTSAKSSASASPRTVPPPSAPSPSPSHSVETGAQKLGEKLEDSVEEKKPEPGVIEITKADYEQAIQHGILAPPPASAGRIGKLYHQAKEIFKFYWNGIKLVNTNRQRANEIKERVKSGGSPLTRWETKFIETTDRDMFKLVPFVAIVVVLEEIIPLIVIYAPGMLPSTCILHSQRERIETKRRQKQRVFAEAMQEELTAITEKEVRKDGEKVGLVALDQVKNEAMALCGMLSLSTFGPPFARRSRLERHLKKLIPDDVLLQREGMGERLTRPELLDALEERGIVATSSETPALQKQLRWWLENVGGQDMSETDAVARRISLVARSGLGKF